MKKLVSLCLAVACSTSVLVAQAEEESAAGSLSLSSEGATAEGSSSGGSLAPEPGLIELGAFLGAIWVSQNHNLRDAESQHYAIDRPTPEIGLRAGYFPLDFLGAELEGAFGPMGKAGDESAMLWAGRAQLVVQMPGYRLTPFALAGVGRLGVLSDKLGDDADPSFHLGVGAKMAMNDMLGFRLDLRDNLTGKNPDTRTDRGDVAGSPEVLLGVVVTLGRTPAKPAAKPADRDQDGFLDRDDKCPDEKGVAPDGCPVKDTDEDSFLDLEDKCPTEKGVAPDGCPVKDSDGDSFLDPDDKCPKEKGVAPDGCPVRDTDADGILDDADKCPTEPETKNGFEDEDGCPDKLPEAVQMFTGVIQGIEFDTDKATIRKKSFQTLDEAVGVLRDYPKLRMEISGHTDTDGKRERNVELSKARAEAVKKYMVDKGIDAGRIETRGAGPDEPIGDNKTKEGKQKNRRIEFKLLQ